MDKHSKEISDRKRFEFGKNWKAFLSTLNDERIQEAEKSLLEMLECKNLVGKKFLDAGSGSGLFSLAARRLGAKVFSFDFDPQSVACTCELKKRYHPDDKDWIIEEGSVLDEDYLNSVGHFDIVYAWGVLHHTGDMWKALENIQIPIATNGLLYIAIYNDQDIVSELWKKVKKFYCSGLIGKLMVSSVMLPYFFFQNIVISIVKYRSPIKQFIQFKKKRGMSIYYDWVDWIGGYPFDVAKPEEIFNYFKKRGFNLINMHITNRLGCNQFVFQKM